MRVLFSLFPTTILLALSLNTLAARAEPPPLTDEAPPPQQDASGRPLSEAEKTWQALVAQVPDLGAMGFRQERSSLSRVPRASDVPAARRICRYARDLHSNIMRRQCFTTVELARRQRQSQVTATMRVGGRFQ